MNLPPMPLLLTALIAVFLFGSLPASAWLGDPATREITRNSGAGPGPLAHSWFPGQKTAELWKEIVSAPVVASAPEKTPAAESEN